MKKVFFLAVVVLAVFVVSPAFANKEVDFRDLPNSITASAVYFLDGDIIFVQKDRGTVESCSAPKRYRITRSNGIMIISELPEYGSKVIKVHFEE